MPVKRIAGGALAALLSALSVNTVSAVGGAVSLLEAVKRGDVVTVRTLLKQDPGSVNTVEAAMSFAPDG